MMLKFKYLKREKIFLVPVNDSCRYFISKEGFVYSNKKQLIRLQPRISKNGYLYVNFSKNGKYKSCYIHRLVAKVYVPNPENKSYVNHIDGNKLNNHASNLEWCTPKENNKHARRLKLCNDCKPVNQYSIDGKLIATYSSYSEAARVLNCSSSLISKACNKTGKALGYNWKNDTELN